VLVCSSSLLIRRHQRARCQAETPLIALCRIPGPALSTAAVGVSRFALPTVTQLSARPIADRAGIDAKCQQTIPWVETVDGHLDVLLRTTLDLAQVLVDHCRRFFDGLRLF